MKRTKSENIICLVCCVVTLFLLGAAVIVFAACSQEGETEPEAVSLTVTAPPDKTSYIEGQFFDAEGLVLTASYSDGSEMVLEEGDYSYTPAKALSLDDTKVVFTYGDVSAAQAIEVTEAVEASLSGARMMITGYEWGPGVNAFIVDFGGEIGSASAEMFTVQSTSSNTVTERDILGVYPCDENGNAADGSSQYLRVEMATGYNVSTPFGYDYTMGFNVWATYSMTLYLEKGCELEAGGMAYSGGSKWSHTFTASERYYPEMEGFETGSYTFNSGEADASDISLTWGLFTPDGAAEDGGKNPLIIWLHGSSDGGTDITVALYGNEVIALTRDEIQSYFTDDGLAGAYVLAVQTPTVWWDGDGSNTPSFTHGEYSWDGQYSYYTDALMETIEYVVGRCGDIDKDRIYLGGGSNGGFMTMNMMFEYGDYFAAFVPNCEAYANGNISDGMIEEAKDRQLWFVVSEDDTIIEATECTLATYYRIVEAGAENVHLSVYGAVIGTDDPGQSYSTHAVSVYLFNNQVKTEIDIDLARSDLENGLVTIDSETGILTSENYSAVSENCTVETDLFAWLASQSR